MSLSGSVIRIVLVSQNELHNVTSSVVLSLCTIGIVFFPSSVSREQEIENNTKGQRVG